MMEKASVKQRLKNIPPVAYMLIVIIAVFSFIHIIFRFQTSEMC